MTVVWLRGRLPERGLFTVEAGRANWTVADGQSLDAEKGMGGGRKFSGFLLLLFFVKIDNISLNVLVLF